MRERLDYEKASPAGYKAMLGLEQFVKKCGLEHALLELVKMRASQINGCAFCLKMHSSDARKAGESEERLYLLDAWEEAPVYSPRERAALAWTEALTLITEGHAPDAVYDEARRAFLRDRAREPHARDRRDQRLEPHQHRLPVDAGDRRPDAIDDA